MERQLPHTEELLSTVEVAALVGVTRPTVSRWVTQGLLVPATRLPGGRMKFRRADVDALVGYRATEATAS